MAYRGSYCRIALKQKPLGVTQAAFNLWEKDMKRRWPRTKARREALNQETIDIINEKVSKQIKSGADFSDLK